MRIRVLFSLLISIMLLTPQKVKPQGQPDLIKEEEQQLKKVFALISREENDSTRLVLSQNFQKQLRCALCLPGSASYPWDSLKYVAKVESPDGLFRLYNWNVPLISGGNRYFCLIQFRDKTRNIPPVALYDFSGSIPEPGHFTGDSLHWYGALYYKVIPFEMKNKQTAYILLGWNGISDEISSKLIDVLTTDNNGAPKFGEAVFPDYQDGKLLRIIFRYSSSAVMNLRYQFQHIPGKQVWNQRKKEYESENKSRWMIVFDHLVPMDPQLEGQYKFYIPASETAEGFLYENYSWKYIKEFDALNP